MSRFLPQQAILRYEQTNGMVAPDEVVTIEGPCDPHEDCVRVLRADGHPGWVSSGELEVLAQDPCKQCGGDGEYQSSAQMGWLGEPLFEKCGACNGTGYEWGDDQ